MQLMIFEDRNEVIALRDRGLYPHGQDHGAGLPRRFSIDAQDNGTVGKIRSDNQIQVVQGSCRGRMRSSSSCSRARLTGLGRAVSVLHLATRSSRSLTTEPSSMIADVRQVGPDGNAERAIAGCIDPSRLWNDPPVFRTCHTHGADRCRTHTAAPT